MDESKLQELQVIEQNLQNLVMQKQSFQMELSEAQSALKELESADDEVFKIIGQLMIKSDKNKIRDELKNREKLIDIRLKSMEKQESSLNDRLEKLRSEVLSEK